jgi:hypothetical protein
VTERASRTQSIKSIKQLEPRRQGPLVTNLPCTWTSHYLSPMCACMQAFTSILFLPRDCGRVCLAQGIQTSREPCAGKHVPQPASWEPWTERPHLSCHMVGRRAGLYSHGWGHSMQKSNASVALVCITSHRIASNRRPSTLLHRSRSAYYPSCVACRALSAPPLRLARVAQGRRPCHCLVSPIHSCIPYNLFPTTVLALLLGRGALGRRR